MIHRLLSDSSPGEVTVFSTSRVRRRLNAIEVSVPDDSDLTLLVGRIWERIPERERLIRDILELLGRSALTAWPRWYDESVPLLRNNQSDSTGVDSDTVLLRAGQCRNVLPGWLQRAARRCKAGRIPLLKRYSAELQLRQLALAMSWQRFVLLLAIDTQTLGDGEAKCFADVSTWAARLADLRIGVLLDERLLDCRGLETIAYRAHSLDPEQTPRRAKREGSSGPPTDFAGAADGEGAGCDETEKRPRRRASRHRFAWPVIGVPHPFSPGEQRLSQSFDATTDLQGLFRHNWPITISTGKRYIVDLLCESTKLIVEVDGYSTHSSRLSFQADRDRDFGLAIDGYTVVRLTHAEIMRDVDASLAKIRAILRSLHARPQGADS